MIEECGNKPRVSVASGGTRAEAVRNALALVKEDICAKVKGNVIVKPNFLSSDNRFASTQADAVIPVIELLMECDAVSVAVAEGGAYSTQTAYENFGYSHFPEEFGIRLIDLNRDTFTKSFEAVTQTRGVHRIAYSDIAASADTLVSVAVAKTHDFATVTLSMKNMMGCVRRIQRPRMHGVELNPLLEDAGGKLWNVLDSFHTGMRAVSAVVFGAVYLSRYIQRKAHHGAMPGYLSQVRALSENIVRLGKVLLPDISVIDGFYAMEGNGPANGTPVKMGIAVAGADAVACDAVMAYIMGFDPMSIGYLNLAHKNSLGVADINSIEIIGGDLSGFRKKLKPHSNYSQQLKWNEAWSK